MGKIITIALIAVGIVAGFAGSYFAMPLLRPAYVQELNARLDSLKMPPDSSMTTFDSLQQTYDEPNLATSLQDSLATLMRLLNDARTAADAIVDSRGRLERKLDSLVSVKNEATELASALTQLEDKELAQVVGELEDGVLKALYNEASRKNKARILQAMPPERAARLIRTLFTQTTNAPGRSPVN